MRGRFDGKKNGGNINSASSSKNEQPFSGTKPVRKWAVSPPGEDTTCWGSPVSDKGEEMMIYKVSYELCRVTYTNDLSTLRDNTEPCYGIIGAI